MGYGPLKAAAAGLVAVALAVWGGLRVLGTHDPSLSPRERLVKSLRSGRPVEARLSWELAHVPFSVEAPAPDSDRERNEAERHVESAAERQATPQTLADRGIVHLLRGRLDRAVDDLERALRLAPDDARLLSDLAAARLSRGQVEKDLEDLARALEAAERAVELDPQLAPALFNRALALERLFLLEPARDAWGEYLKVDPSSGWADEARRHLEDLAAPPAAAAWEKARALLDDERARDEAIRRAIAAFPQETRQHAEEGLLGAWAEAVRAGRSEEATRQLALARRIGQALAARGEHLPADAVAAIDRASADPAATAALAQAHLDYLEAQKLRAADPGKARPLLERAQAGFEAAGSPFAAWAALYLEVCRFLRYEYPPALAAVRHLLAEERNQRYPGLLTRSWWILGLIHLGDGQPTDALEAYHTALSIAERSGAVEDKAGVHAVLVENYRYLGEPLEAWRHQYEALTLIPRISNPRRLDAVLSELAESSETAGLWRAALYVRSEVVRYASATGEPAFVSYSLLERSRTRHLLGDVDGAERDLVEARRLNGEIGDEDMRRRNEAELLLAEAELEPTRDPTNRIEATTRALEFYGGRDNHFFLAGLYLARARAALALGDEESAEADLRRGIDDVEWQRANVPEEQLRISFFDEAKSLFDEMIRLQAERPVGAEPALEFAERARARALLDRLGPLGSQRASILASAVEPLGAREIREALPAGVAIVEYEVLDDRLLAWVVRPDGVKLEARRIAAAELDELVAKLRAALIEHDEPRLAAAAASLHDLLIQPILPHVGARDRLVVVPDGSLHSVPFAALLDRTTKRYLLQDRIVAVAPSATFYIEALARDRGLASRSSGRPTVLAIGNPRFARGRGRELPDLPASEEEAAAVANLFPGSEMLTGEAATKQAFLAAAGRHQWLHFGGHAVVNQEYPFLSHLLLAPEGDGDPGLLFAHELYGTRFESTRLTVLAGCETGGGPVAGEGVLSLARAFLAAGVPTVVASLWSVDDAASGRFFAAFYERLRQGDDPAEALRAAQLELLERGEEEWAAYEVIGNS